MLSVKRGIEIPSDAVDERAYEDLPASLHWIHQNSLNQDYEFLDRVLQISADFPLLDGAEVEYWEARSEDLAVSGLSEKDQRGITNNFLANPCGVLVYSLPKLILSSHLREVSPEHLDGMIRHELVHLEQTVRGDSLLIDGGQLWKGALYDGEYLKDINGWMFQQHPFGYYSYFSLPWEEEAYRRTEGDDAYEWKRACYHLAHLINQRLPEGHEHNTIHLAKAAQKLLNDGIAATEICHLTPSPSSQHLANAYTSASLNMDAIEGEAAWQMVMQELGWKPEIQELTSIDDAWDALIDASVALVERIRTTGG